ncbi:MAG: FMN-binding protein [Clostridiales bacterium]|nr:FMN-binding protein [Clostridiales bacterium]
MKKKKIAISVFIAIVVAAIFITTIILKNIESNMEQLTGLVIPNFDLTGMEDGTYTGKYSVFPVSAEVEVTVENNRINEIRLIKHRHGQGAAAEIIPSRVVETQTFEIDSISGATFSSKVILKAIENALISAGN